MKKSFSALLFTILLVLSFCLGAFSADDFLWEKETDLPTANQYGAVASTGSKIVCISGTGGGAAVQIYDRNTGLWTTDLSPYPGGLNFLAAEAIGNTVYVIGGRNAGNNVPTGALHAYDVENDAWEVKTSRPVSATNVATTVIEGKLYVVGGLVRTASGSFTSQTRIDIYDPVTDSWTGSLTMPAARALSNVVYHENKLYVFGGYRQNGATSTQAALNTMDIYDFNTETWASGAVMPTGGYNRNATVLMDGKIYLFNTHRTDSNLSNIIQVYDPQTDTWTVSESTLKAAGIHLAEIYNGKLYLVFNDTIEVTGVADRLYVLLDPGEQAQLSLDHNLAVNSAYLWASTNAAVADVDNNGMVTAVDEGVCYIECRSADGSYMDYIPVKVMEGLWEIRLALHLNAGESKRLWMDDDALSVVWASMGSSIATVDSVGKVTGHSKGLTIIEGAKDGRTDHIYVRVNE